MSTKIAIKTVDSKVAINATTGTVVEVYTFDTENIPTKNMMLVQDSRKKILQSINLDSMFTNLSSCVDLLDISYNAVSGIVGVSPKVAKIQSGFLNTISDSVSVMQAFQTGTEATVYDLIKAYGFLTKPQYTKLPSDKNGIILAGKVFEAVREKASLMREEAEKLSVRFAGIRDATSETNQEIMTARDADYELIERKNEEMAKMLGMLQGYTEVKEDLDSEISEYSTQYADMAKRIEKQEKKAFALGLTAAILGGVTQVVQGVLPMAKSLATGDIPGSNTGGRNTQAPVDSNLGKRIAESEKTIKELSDEIEIDDKELEDLKAQLESKEVSEDAKKVLRKKQDNIELKLKDNKSLRSSETYKLSTYKKSVSEPSDSIDGLGDKFEQMSQKADDGLDRMYASLDKIATNKAEAAKSRREAILKLSELTHSIENATTEKRDLEVVLNSLITAVGCMRLVEVYIADIALFWKNVEKFCETLVIEIKGINDEVKNFEGIENYTIFFLDEDFVRGYLINMLRWVAMNTISTDYLAAFNETFAKQKAVMSRPELAREKHWELAQKLAGEASAIFDRQLVDLEAESK